MSEKPTINDLRERFQYDPEAGIVTYRHQLGKGRRRAGTPCGCKDTKGRLRTWINGRSFAVSHIAFAIYYGAWPEDQIDHINLDKEDNRIVNLREATNQENCFNRKGRSRSGFKGVTFHRGRYCARIGVDYQIINLGSFNTGPEAFAAYKSAAAKHHGAFSNHEHR